MEKEYYERYWAKEYVDNKGIMNIPPEWNEEDLNRILKAIKPFINGNILDVGCGDGFFSSVMADMDTAEVVYGLDISNKAIDIAKRQHSNIEFRTGFITKLPYDSNCFDTVTAIEVIEHILDIQKMFEELNRVLKNNGILIITTTDFNLLKKLIISFFFDKYFYPTNPHIRFFTKRTLRELLIRYGFEIIKYVWNGSYFGTMPKGQIVVAKKIKNII